jgi:hypothetical protein
MVRSTTRLGSHASRRDVPAGTRIPSSRTDSRLRRVRQHRGVDVDHHLLTGLAVFKGPATRGQFEGDENINSRRVYQVEYTGKARSISMRGSRTARSAERQTVVAERRLARGLD